MRTFAGLLLSLSFVLTGPPALAAPPAPDPNHPILGIWQLTLPDGSCSEIYRFRGDGTTIVTSAAEVSESQFTIPAEPSKNGYYRLVDTIVKDNGEKDCLGQVMQVGTSATNFVLFHPSGALFLMCATESTDSCIGPFERVIGQGI